MVSKSSTLRTARNALQTSLVILGKIPIPGIDAVTEALGQALTKVQEMRDNATGWIDLSERVQSIAFLVSTDYDMTPVLGKRLLKVLQDITEDINTCGKSGYFKRFLNSREDASFLTSHTSTLNDLVTDITFEVCIKSNRKSTQIRDELNKFKSDLAAMVITKEDDAKGVRVSQNFTIKESDGVVELKGELDVNIQHVHQSHAGPIEVTNRVVGISHTAGNCQVTVELNLKF
ncbi:hypothetical protein C8R45DRAFT_1209199 [Mycena sanguinolenta]|nr:hypothetical protein C8R45DRAFT_1209199 [Mycena sanguinolenta]